MNKLGSNIKAFRKQLGMTQTELGEKTGYKKAMISKIEQGKQNITQDKLMEFAYHLHTTPTQLINWNGEDDIRLTGEEKEIIQAYRKKPEEIKTVIKRILDLE